MKRIMYIEDKSQGLAGPGRIGWVTLSKSKRSYHYDGKTFQKIGSGYKYNCIEAETGDHYWISGPKKNGSDTLYGAVVQIDEDAREEYWAKIRNLPTQVDKKQYRG